MDSNLPLNVDLSQYKNEEIAKILDDAVIIGQLELQPGWKLIDEACKRLAQVAQQKLLKIDPSKMSEICELQQIAKLYGNALPNLVSSFKAHANVVFGEAKSRQLVKKDKKRALHA